MFSDDSDESYENIPIKKIPTKKIQMKEIKCIDLFLEEASDLTSIHPEIHEIIISHPFQEKLFLGKM